MILSPYLKLLILPTSPCLLGPSGSETISCSLSNLGDPGFSVDYFDTLMGICSTAFPDGVSPPSEGAFTDLSPQLPGIMIFLYKKCIIFSSHLNHRVLTIYSYITSTESFFPFLLLMFQGILVQRMLLLQCVLSPLSILSSLSTILTPSWC